MKLKDSADIQDGPGTTDAQERKQDAQTDSSSFCTDGNETEEERPRPEDRYRRNWHGSRQQSSQLVSEASDRQLFFSTDGNEPEEERTA